MILCTVLFACSIVPHGLKFRNPNAPPSFAEMDTPKSPTAATGPPGNQIFQGSDLVRNAGQMGKSDIVQLLLYVCVGTFVKIIDMIVTHWYPF